MSEDFESRLFPRLPAIVEHFGTPFHIYDEVGIREGMRQLLALFSWCPDFREYFAVKALPNLRIMTMLLEEGCGFDCSSIPELVMARQVGATPDRIMFTSNNTSPVEYQVAQSEGGCILNLDDISFVGKVPEPFPELICFRYNPGPDREGNAIIGKPEEAKYGLRRDQLLDACKEAIERGAKRFGLHTMIISNELNYTYMVETVWMLLDLVELLGRELGVEFDFSNIGGGIGIPYKPDDQPFNLGALAAASRGLFQSFGERNGYQPKLFMESGRAITGPHGVLATTVINRMNKHREYLGVDACMSSLMRPGMYPTAYHRCTVLRPDGTGEIGIDEPFDVVGSLCENNDKFAVQRGLPAFSAEGDSVIIHDTGAHGIAMGFWYNGRLRPKELLLLGDGSVELIRRAETVDDYLRTQLDFERNVLKL